MKLRNLSIVLLLGTVVLVSAGCSNNSPKKDDTEKTTKVEKKKKPVKQTKTTKEDYKDINDKQWIIMAWQNFEKGYSLRGFHYFMDGETTVLQQPKQRAVKFQFSENGVTLLPATDTDKEQTVSFADLKKEFYTTDAQKTKTNTLVAIPSTQALVNGDLPPVETHEDKIKNEAEAKAAISARYGDQNWLSHGFANGYWTFEGQTKFTQSYGIYPDGHIIEVN